MSIDVRKDNLTDRPVTDFVPNKDTIYITKMKGGFQITHLCKFVSFERGIVTGDVIEFEPDWAYHSVDVKEGIQIRARLAKCYLWGMRPTDSIDWPHCNWFDSKTKKVKE